jgi:glycosyltransferase involved in cell wall biosynthesis
MKCCDYLGYGTSFDFKHIVERGYLDKAREVNYGIPCGEYEYKFATIEEENRFRSLVNVPADARMILSVGGWWPHKKMEEIIQAFKEVNDPNSHLVLCGYDSRFGPPPQNVGDATNISLVTNATHEQIMMLMATADLYVMNSESEGFGLVLLEAMVNHTPWIARNIAGAHDMKEYGVAYDTYEELVNCLKPDLTEHYKEMLAMNAQAGYDYTLKYRSIVNMIDDIDKVLQEAGHDRAEYSNTPR